MITLICNSHPLNEIGQKSLSGYLQNHKIPIRLIYLAECNQLSKDIIAQILELIEGSVLVGFSLMSKDLNIVLPLINAIRQKKQIPVILGGVHPTALPKESLNYSDFVCIGEGEEPLRILYTALIEKTNNYRIPNIGYKKDGNIIINPVTFFVESLDAMPYPDYKFVNSYFYVIEKQKIDKIPENPYERKHFFNRKDFYFYSQRGCRLSCTYCSNSLYHELAKNSGCTWYRTSSVNRIKSELQIHLKNLPFIELIVINDDDFLVRDINELQEISDYLKNNLKLPFTINAIPSYVTEEKMSILIKNGLLHISFGVQSGSDRILKELYKRPINNKAILKAANIIASFKATGLGVDYGFILDNPYEDDNDWKDSIDLLSSLPKPRTISLYSLQFFPGTKLTNRAYDDGFVSSLFPDLNKDYRKDIKMSYKNTLFFLYSYFDLPVWFNKIMLSNIIVRSLISFPIRFLFAYPIRYYIRGNKKIADANRVCSSYNYWIFIITLLKKSGLYLPLKKLKSFIRG